MSKKEDKKYEAWLNKMARIAKREGITIREACQIDGKYSLD